MTDWITLAVEAAGIVILCVWVVVPIREFRGILRRLVAANRGFEVVQPVRPVRDEDPGPKAPA